MKRKNASKNKSKKMEKFFMCHHCKLFLHEKYLVKCNYDSSIMGLPIINNPLCEDLQILNPKRRLMSGKRKRDEKEGYDKKCKFFF